MKSRVIKQANLDRRNFLRLAGMGAGAIVAFTMGNQALAQVVPKPGGGTAAPVCPKPLIPTLKNAISSNHGHVLTVTLTELKTNGEKSYDIKGTSGHPHAVEITNEILLTLLRLGAVEVESTAVAGHTHIVKLEIVNA